MQLENVTHCSSSKRNVNISGYLVIKLMQLFDVQEEEEYKSLTLIIPLVPIISTFLLMSMVRVVTSESMESRTVVLI